MTTQSLIPPSTKKERCAGQPPIRYLDTVAAYDLWSKVYDSDGNFLQALDSLEMQSLLPHMLSQIARPPPWKIVDLGCGTGRNTTRLLDIPGTTTIGLDASAKMLQIAKSNVSTRMAALNGSSEGSKEVEFELYDLITDLNVPACSVESDALISTLVVEHIPLPTFFHAVSQILKPGGIALITNMHSEMGAISQAGFIDPSTRQKVRPQSFAHRLEDVIAEANKQGLDIVGDVLERRVDDQLSKILGIRANKWIGVTVWFGILLRKKDEE